MLHPGLDEQGPGLPDDKKSDAMTSPHILLKAWNLRARKEMGQNFLINPAVAAQIVSQAQLSPQDVVLEIGAGLGALTIAVAGQVARVVAVEKDRNLVPLLQAELLAHGLDHVQVIAQDILAMDIDALAAAHGGQLVVMGNLPYNISSQVVVKLIEQRQHLKHAVLMFQKELAQRLCAGPGSKTYGRLSVILQYCADLRLLKDLPADQFHPRPKVDSAVLGIQFKSRITQPVADERLLTRVVQAAFGKRRKTLRNALSGSLLGLNGADSRQLLERSAIDPHRRAETLTVEEFVRLTNIIDQFSGSQRT